MKKLGMVLHSASIRQDRVIDIDLRRASLLLSFVLDEALLSTLGSWSMMAESFTVSGTVLVASLTVQK